MTRLTCEVSAPPLPGDPPATVRSCGVRAVVAVREEHTLHYRGGLKTWRDVWPGYRCARHDVPAERVSGVVGDDENGWRVSRTVEREALR